MDSRSHREAGDHIRPQFADNISHGFSSQPDTFRPGELLVGSLTVAELCGVNPRLYEPLHLEPADHPPRDNSYQQPCPSVDRGNAPAEEPEEQDKRNFVDHRGGNQERKRDSKRYASRDKAYEERD